ncbi:hypothetical protein HDU93_001244, partial [Gonapodya sp. JEL0774]
MDEWEDIADDFDVLSLDSAISGALSVVADASSSTVTVDGSSHPTTEADIPRDGNAVHVNPDSELCSIPSPSASAAGSAERSTHSPANPHPAIDHTLHNWTDTDFTTRPNARAFGRLRFGVRSNKTRTGGGNPNCGPDCRWCIPERARKIKWRHRKWEWEMRETMREQEQDIDAD